MLRLLRKGVGGLLFAACAGVSLAQMPPSDSGQYAAKVLNLTGRVSVLKDSQPWALMPGDSVQVKQVIVSGPDGYATFQVSDGSTFEVFPNSTVIFRKNAPNWRDLIDVLVGRIRVHIQHWGNQPNPNRIYTPTAVISVRGTTFDVSVDENDEATVIEVEEGEVVVQHALQPGTAQKVLRAGESITVYRNYPLAATGIDKGTFIKHGLRALIDAMQTLIYQNPGRVPGIGGGIPGGPGGTVGDTGKPAPPPATGGDTGGVTAPAPPPPPPGG